MKKAVPIQQLVNWYYGNYCTRKCYLDEQRQEDHIPKLQELAKKMRGVEMTHNKFLTLIRSDKTICNLSDEEWQKRTFSWRNNKCLICKKFKIR